MRLLVSGRHARFEPLLSVLEQRADLRYQIGDPEERVDAVVILPATREDGQTEEAALEREIARVYDLLVDRPPGERVVLLSSLHLLDAYPEDWLVDENWAPRPRTDFESMTSHLLEIVTREVCRVEALTSVILRTGDPTTAAGMAGATWTATSVGDIAWAITAAVGLRDDDPRRAGRTRVFHIPAGGPGRYPVAAAGTALGYVPAHPASVRRDPAPSPPMIPRWTIPSAEDPIVVFGGGGPLGVSAARGVLGRGRTVRSTDVRPFDHFAALPEQSAGAPKPEPLAAPNEIRIVDITDPDGVRQTLAGARAAVNCSVSRNRESAFRVNTVGALVLMKAALAEGIRRIVHAGPQMIMLAETGYDNDRDLAESVPRRPGAVPYHLSKYLGQEICRIYAEEYGFEVVALAFYFLLDPSSPENRHLGSAPWAVSWNDAGRAIAAAADIDELPNPFELIHVNSDAPHGRFPNAKAKRVLDWEPRDALEHYWRRDDAF